MNNYCEGMKPLLSEYVDGVLDSRRAAEVENHLAECPDCSELVQSFRRNKSLMSALPLRQTSSSFDADLARRIAALNAPSPRRSWLSGLADMFKYGSRTWRPAFAAVAAVGVIAGSSLVFRHPGGHVVPQQPSDPALIAQVVAQHQRYAEAQPLSDWSAQTLSKQLDAATSSSGDPTAVD